MEASSMALSSPMGGNKMGNEITRRQMMESVVGAGLAAAGVTLPAAAEQNSGSPAASDKVFDVHAHIDPPAENFSDFGPADEVIAKDYSERVKYLDRNRIDQSVLTTGFTYRRTEGIVSTRKMNDLVATYVAKHSDRFPVGIGTVQLSDGEASLRELERMAKDLKFKGVVWHHGFTGFNIDHPFMRPLLKQARELKLIPFIHCRQPEHESVWRLEILAEEFPDMTFVAYDTFTTGEDRDHMAQILGRRKNILCDTGASVYNGERTIENFVKRFGAERLLVGSDGGPSLNLQIVRNAQLSAQEKQMILSGNARKLLNL
jgi:predicted TIM-barrel fold metal-dependent hydrolase